VEVRQYSLTTVGKLSKEVNFFISKFASEFLYNLGDSKLEVGIYSPATGRGDHALRDLQVPRARSVAPDNKTFQGLRGG
jgi:hypothetical protein